MCWTPLYGDNKRQRKYNTYTFLNTYTLLHTSGSKDELNIFFMRKSQQTSQHGTQNVKTHNSSLLQE